MTGKSPKKKCCNPLKLQHFTIVCRVLQAYAISPSVPKRGLGGISVTPFLKSTSEKSKKVSGEKSGTFSNSPCDPRLQALISHWANLPESLRESMFRQVCETLILQNLTPNYERSQS